MSVSLTSFVTRHVKFYCFYCQYEVATVVASCTTVTEKVKRKDRCDLHVVVPKGVVVLLPLFHTTTKMCQLIEFHFHI